MQNDASMVDSIEVNMQSSIRIKANVGIIYIDPFHMKEEPHDAEYILITHDHYDHYSLEDIQRSPEIPMSRKKRRMCGVTSRSFR